MAAHRWNDRLNVVVNVGVILFAAYLVMRPGGPVSNRLEKRARIAAIESVWPQLRQSRVTHAGSDTSRFVVEFGDYQCPSCRTAHQQLDLLAQRLNLTIAYRHFPLTSIHPLAEQAAKASICAERQDRFAAMQELLYGRDDWMEQDNPWTALAQEAGVADTTSFRSCLSSVATSQRLTEDILLVQQLKLAGTPSYVGRGGVFLGVPDSAKLGRIVAR